MGVKLLTEHHLEFQSLKGGRRGSSESTRVKMPHCWKSHVAAHILSAYRVITAFKKVCQDQRIIFVNKQA